jgi:hypothetical protein
MCTLNNTATDILVMGFLEKTIRERVVLICYLTVPPMPFNGSMTRLLAWRMEIFKSLCFFDAVRVIFFLGSFHIYGIS